MSLSNQQELLQSLSPEKKAEAERQINQMLERGYKREHLWITPDGNVLFDSEACDYDILHENSNCQASDNQ